MTTFDIIALVVLGGSAVVGLLRGFVREVVTVVAFVAAAVAAFFLLRFTGPIARDAIDPDWLGSVLALLGVFLVVYLIVRIAGGRLTRSVQQSSLNSIDRAGGVGVGLIRGLAFLGVFYLLFSMITPADRVPHWVGDAVSWPLARQSGLLIARFAPDGMSAARGVGPMLQRAVSDDPAPLDATGDASNSASGASEPAAPPAAPRRSRRANP